jgi:pimeloyl-ACP methyl ester carboxylesterase
MCFVTSLVPSLVALLFVAGPSSAGPKAPPPQQRVSMSNGERKISGDLWLPDGDGPFPAILLIPGGGPGNGAPPKQDTDKGFQTLTSLVPHLRVRGIAALLVEPRRGPDETLEDRASDVLAALKFMRLRKEIDQDKIGLCGHSLGGIVAPMAAARSKDVKFVVILAGPTIALIESSLSLMERVWRDSGAGEAEVAEMRETARRFLTALKDGKSLEPHRPPLMKLFESQYARLPEDQRKRFAGGKEFATTVVDRYMTTTAADRFLMSYDPKTTLQQVHCPVLALYADKDPKVPFAANREALLRSLPKDADQTAMVIPGADHMFQSIARPSTPKSVSGFPDIVAGWILTRLSQGPPRTQSR